MHQKTMNEYLLEMLRGGKIITDPNKLDRAAHAEELQELGAIKTISRITHRRAHFDQLMTDYYQKIRKEPTIAQTPEERKFFSGKG